MDGIILINKPQGMTSHDVVNRVRRIMHTKKVGHCGTRPNGHWCFSCWY